MRVAAAVVLLCALGAAPAWAQLAPRNATGVAMGQLAYHVRDLEANKKFWMALGGKPLMVAAGEALVFPGVIVILWPGQPSGTSDGAVINHVAFRVPSFASVEAAGFSVERTQGFPGVGSVRTPEGERIELFENAATNLTFTFDPGHSDAAAERHNRPVSRPIEFHHIHLYVPEGAVAEAKAWYVRMFGAVPGKRSQYEAADLPGVNFNFSVGPRPTAPTRGRMLDHIGFVVTNLAAFRKRLEAMGVTFDARSSEGSDFFTDPWGSSIELSESVFGYK